MLPQECFKPASLRRGSENQEVDNRSNVNVNLHLHQKEAPPWRLPSLLNLRPPSPHTRCGTAIFACGGLARPSPWLATSSTWLPCPGSSWTSQDRPLPWAQS